MPRKKLSDKEKARRKLIRQAMRLMGRYGLRVYGQNVDLGDGEMLDGLMDYDTNDVIRLMELEDAGDLYERARP